MIGRLLFTRDPSRAKGRPDHVLPLYSAQHTAKTTTDENSIKVGVTQFKNNKNNQSQNSNIFGLVEISRYWFVASSDWRRRLVTHSSSSGASLFPPTSRHFDHRSAMMSKTCITAHFLVRAHAREAEPQTALYWFYIPAPQGSGKAFN